MTKLTDGDVETIKEAALKLQARDRWHSNRLMDIAAMVAVEVDRVK